jgi:trigger factor
MLLELCKRRKGINNATTIAADLLKSNFDLFIGKKVGDVVTVNTKVYLKMTTN